MPDVDVHLRALLADPIPPLRKRDAPIGFAGVLRKMEATAEDRVMFYDSMCTNGLNSRMKQPVETAGYNSRLKQLVEIRFAGYSM